MPNNERSSHAAVQAPEDFGSNALHIHRKCSRWRPREKYVLDKVLGRHCRETPQLLTYAGTKTSCWSAGPKRLSPACSLWSTRKLDTPERVLRNYLDRLEDISLLASRVGAKRAIFVRYDQVVDEPRPTLARITRHLNLKIALSERYDRLWSTGIWGIGDGSESIIKGHVERTARVYPVKVPEPSRSAARRAYDACVDRCDAALPCPHDDPRRAARCRSRADRQLQLETGLPIRPDRAGRRRGLNLARP